jgi:acyl-CoA-binding protein
VEIMPTTKAQFEKAAEEAKKLPERPDDEILLQLYALYKQATKGNVSGDRPGMFNLVGRAKYDAWAELKGKSKQASMQGYINLVDKLKNG